jgi:phosphotriesterase-related protein
MPADASAFVQTVLGPVPPDKLGWMLPHEHLVVDWSYALRREGRPVEAASAVERVVSFVQAAARVGVGGLVDAGMEIYGPSPCLLMLVARQTGIQLVASSGMFETDQIPPPSWACPPASPASAAEHFVWVARNGLSGSGVKPGIIKVGTSPRAITEIEETCLRGAAEAQKITGLGLMTHSRNPSTAERQIDILEDAGADLRRVSIGHIGWMSGSEDSARNRRLARRGVMLALDCVGSPARSDEEYLAIALDLIEAGHASQILLSHDAVAYVRGLQGVYEREWFLGDFTPLHDRLLPLLRDHGIDEATIRQMTVDNPHRLLTINPVQYPGARETLLKPATDECLEWLAIADDS